jgi:hypothetical protein
LLEFTFLLFFLYQSLHAVRHMFLFFLLAIPIMAKELTVLISSHDNWFTRRSEKILAEQKQIKGDRIYIPAHMRDLYHPESGVSHAFQK